MLNELLQVDGVDDRRIVRAGDGDGDLTGGGVGTGDVVNLDVVDDGQGVTGSEEVEGGTRGGVSVIDRAGRTVGQRCVEEREVADVGQQARQGRVVREVLAIELNYGCTDDRSGQGVANVAVRNRQRAGDGDILGSRVSQFGNRRRIHDVRLGQLDDIVRAADGDVEGLARRRAKRIRNRRRVVDGDVLTIAQVIEGRRSRSKGERGSTGSLVGGLGEGAEARD